ncbi:MAG: ribbon-helix-helix protein, CopG family [Actinomycetota bacterium]
MRTTVTLADDVAAAIERLRRERDIGLSEAVNDLIRAGLTRKPPTRPFRQKTYDMGELIDVTNIGKVLNLLDEVERRD